MFHYVPMIFPINCWLCSHLWILLMVILPMIFSWYSIPMVSLWFSMTPPWFANDISIIFPCFFNDIPMFFPMIFPWYAHDFPIIFPWYAHDFPLLFPWYSTISVAYYPPFSHRPPHWRSLWTSPAGKMWAMAFVSTRRTKSPLESGKDWSVASMVFILWLCQNSFGKAAFLMGKSW